MSACVYLCMYVFVYVCLCMCVLMCVHAYVLVHMCLSVYTCVHVYVCVSHTCTCVPEKGQNRKGRPDGSPPSPALLHSQLPLPSQIEQIQLKCILLCPKAQI